MKYPAERNGNKFNQQITRRKFVRNAASTAIGMAVLKSKIFASVAEQAG